MKKTLFFIAFTAISLIGFSQTLTIDTGGVDIAGQTLNYVFSDTLSSGNYHGDVYVEITNTGSSDVEIQVKRTPGTVNCGAYYFPTGHTMCLGVQCYQGDIIPSATNTKTLAAGATMELHVQIQFEPMGETNEFYEIYEYGNTDNNLVSFNTHYKSIYLPDSCTNVVNNITNNFSIKSYPNPANNRINFSYNINSNNSYITIHDITGKKVGSIELNSNLNNTSFNTGNLQSGIYFYNVYVDGTKTKTDKFIVRH